MIWNFIITALRNIERNRLHTALSVGSLALGLSAAIFTLVFISNELSFDEFINNKNEIYVVGSKIEAAGQPEITMDYTPDIVRRWIEQDIPEVKRSAMLIGMVGMLQRGEISGNEDIAWVDGDFFGMMPLPIIAGNLPDVSRDSDWVVLTKSAANKYFGRSDPIGSAVQYGGRHPLRVIAVVADLPAETHLTHTVFASGGASFSPITQLRSADAPSSFMNMVFKVSTEPGPMLQFLRGRAYLEIDDPEAAKKASARLTELAGARQQQLRLPPGSNATFMLIPLGDFHTYPFRGANLGATDARVSRGALYALSLVGALILVLGVMNFINLTTARASRRAVEVGVRKAVGASRGNLHAQFLGETLIQTAFALLIAIVLVGALLPVANGYLLRSMRLDWSDPILLASLVSLVPLVGVAAGAYPALVLSSFQPNVVLKGGAVPAAGSLFIRQALTVLQFAMVILLLLGVLVIWRQTTYALNKGLALDKEAVLLVQATPCRGAFEKEVRRLPGVQSAACSSRAMLGIDDFNPLSSDAPIEVGGRPPTMISLGLVDAGFFELYGLLPRAGRLFQTGRAGDELPGFAPGEARTGATVLNETAARRLGFATPSSAVGARLGVGGQDSFEVIGVVPDFTIDLLNAEVKPTAYIVDFESYPLDQVLNIKLRVGSGPDTVDEIDKLWRRTGQAEQIRRQFLDHYLQRIYTGVLRQRALLTVLCGVAITLASMGLLGLAIFVAHRRTKEIGVRKAMGATTREIMLMLVWQFTKPVLIASVIAWPLGYFAMQSWLSGFAYRTSIAPWLFPAASGVALVIAWVTISLRTYLVARERPANALRYE